MIVVVAGGQQGNGGGEVRQEASYCESRRRPAGPSPADAVCCLEEVAQGFHGEVPPVLLDGVVVEARCERVRVYAHQHCSLPGDHSRVPVGPYLGLLLQRGVCVEGL